MFIKYCRKISDMDVRDSFNTQFKMFGCGRSNLYLVLNIALIMWFQTHVKFYITLDFIVKLSPKSFQFNSKIMCLTIGR